VGVHKCVCGCASMYVCMMYTFIVCTASQQDKENSDKKKKRHKSNMSLNQIKYSYETITCCTVINTVDHYHGHTPLILV